MRRRIILGVSAAAVLAAGGLVAAWFLVIQSRPSGKLDTQLKGVTVQHTHAKKKAKKPTRRTGRVLALDKPCWPYFGGDAARSLARNQIDLGRPTKPIWAQGMHGYMEYPPSYCNGTLYVNTFTGITYAVDALTGRILWARHGSGPKPSTPAIAGDRLIVSSTGGTVTALDRSDGHTIWQLRIDAKVESSPVVIGQLAYFGATDGRLFAVNVGTGHIRWAYNTGGRINSSPSVWGRRICITTYAGSIFCLDRLTARKLWDVYIKRNFVQYESFYASPSTDGRRLFTISRSGKVVAVRATDGQVLWTHELSSYGYSTPAVSRGRVFVGDFNGYLHCYDAATGNQIWQHYVGGRILGPAVVVGPLVFFSTLEKKTYAVRFSDGRLVWHTNIGKYSPGIATDRHYFFSLNGLLVAYRGRNSPPEQRVRQPAGAAAPRRASGGAGSSRDARP
jgi:outer membrane protein assembly factor BamB